MCPDNNPEVDFQQRVNQVLTHHGFALPLLTSGYDAEFAFYTYDVDRKMRFVSDSFWSICQIRPENWGNNLFESRLTDHPWNKKFSTSPLTGMKVPRRSRYELLDDFGNRVKIEAWQKELHLNGMVIGVAGLCKRIIDAVADANQPSDLTPDEIRDRIASLSEGERDVLELVIAGHLNKTIARKLDIAMRTVESRRSKAMAKMGVGRLADLVRIWIAAK